MPLEVAKLNVKITETSLTKKKTNKKTNHLTLK